MAQSRGNKYKFKKKPTIYKTKTDELFEQRLNYEKTLSIAGEQLFVFPSETEHVEGGFGYSLWIRGNLLLTQDYENLIKFYRYNFYKKLTIYRFFYLVLLGILLIPPLYYGYFIIRYILGRLPHYIFTFVESFFENFLFRKFFDPEKYWRLDFFYNKILLRIKGVLIASGGLGFFRKLFALPLEGTSFIELVGRKKGRPHGEEFLEYFYGLERRIRFMQKEIKEVGLFPYMIGLDRFYTWRRFYRQYRFLIIQNEKGRRGVDAFGTINKNHFYRTGRIYRLQTVVAGRLLPGRLWKYFVTQWYDFKAYTYTILPKIQYDLVKHLPYIYEGGVFIFRVITVVPVYIINYVIPLRGNFWSFEGLRRKIFRANRKITTLPGLANHHLLMASRNPYYVKRIKKLQAVGALPRYASENNGQGGLILLLGLLAAVIFILHINLALAQFYEGYNIIYFPVEFYSLFIL